LGQRRGLKNPWAREEDVFLVHPQKGLNGLIRNWCTGDYWFTPASNEGNLHYNSTMAELLEISAGKAHGA
jgi:hypothetical protein